MAAVWTTPRTWSVSETLTATLFNQHIRDNLDWLKTPASASATLTSNISTTSTSFVDATGLSVTFTTRGGNVLALAMLTVQASAAETAYFRLNLDGTGTSFLCQQRLASASDVQSVALMWLFSSVSAASHTIKVQYASAAGATVTLNGSGTANMELICSEVGWS